MGGKIASAVTSPESATLSPIGPAARALRSSLPGAAKWSVKVVRAACTGSVMEHGDKGRHGRKEMLAFCLGRAVIKKGRSVTGQLARRSNLHHMPEKAGLRTPLPSGPLLPAKYGYVRRKVWRTTKLHSPVMTCPSPSYRLRIPTGVVCGKGVVLPPTGTERFPSALIRSGGANSERRRAYERVSQAAWILRGWEKARSKTVIRGPSDLYLLDPQA